MRKTFRFLAVLLICAMLLPCAVAMAADTDTADDATDGEQSLASATDEKNIINGSELTAWLEQYMADNNLTSSQISVGYCYTATGDSWYYNGDKWFYPASMYKVPLIMLLSEKVKSGELEQDSLIYDKDVSTIESYILTYSNNDWAHIIRQYLGGDETWRTNAKKYAQLSDEDYDSDYLDYCYFSNRYMTQVMTTLYTQQENFPNVIDCLLVAEPVDYYHQNNVNNYDIAQKYGSYTDSRGEKFNHCTAIIYTPNPFIVTVMTSNVDSFEAVETIISDIGAKLMEYTVSLDSQLDSHLEKLAAIAAEEERQAQEAAAEAQRLAEEQAQQAAEAQAQAEAQAKKDAQSAKRQAILDKVLMVVKILVVVAVVLLVLRFCVRVYKLVQAKEAQQKSRSRRGVERRVQSFDDYDDEPEFADEEQIEQSEKPEQGYTMISQSREDEDYQEEPVDTEEYDEAANEAEYSHSSFQLPKLQRRVRQEDYELLESNDQTTESAGKKIYRGKSSGRNNSKYTPRH